MAQTNRVGSQRLLQIAVNNRPELLRDALQRSGAVRAGESVLWVSPLSLHKYCEYRDAAAIRALALDGVLRVPLKQFWPARGCVWDALGIAGSTRPVLVEAKAHIPEAASPASQAASEKSRVLIEESLSATRRSYAPRSKADWTQNFYQYANRLAYQYYLRKLNFIESSLVFLYFTNATDMEGPLTEQEWQGASRLIHAVLGLPADLTQFGVYDAYIDARHLVDAK